MKHLKVLLVDDHALFLAGFKNFLSANGLEVIGTARSGPEALLKYEMLQPDVVLMDIQMAGCDGVQTTQMIKQEYPAATIVMLTADEEQNSILAALQAGAAGYLLKGMEPEQFLAQLGKLVQGEAPLAPSLTSRLLQTVAQQQQLLAEQNKGGRQELTPRQQEILKLLVQGCTYKEIGVHLQLKEVTVKYHINEMLNKLKLSNRSQLVAYASQQGIR